MGLGFRPVIWKLVSERWIRNIKWRQLINHESLTLGKPWEFNFGQTIWDEIEVLLGRPRGTTWGTSREQTANMLPTHWEQGRKTKKITPPNPTPTPKRKKRGPAWLHSEPSHWLHEISISKTVGHHSFWPGLMAGAEFWRPSYINWGYFISVSY
jgi:hypothetical protein